MHVSLYILNKICTENVIVRIFFVFYHASVCYTGLYCSVQYSLQDML